jgi:methylmalonyl-CoA mutase N-terminal domain/subunit
MKDRVGATSPASWRMRFHTQTAGSTLTAQQPLSNVVRTAYQALAGVLGGTQSLHTNSYDEALGLPTEASATVALRTQQILGYESGVADTVDPLAGSYFVEALTDEVESKAAELIARIDELGGATAAIEAGFQQDEIEDAAYRTARRVEADEEIVVGVNRFVAEEADPAPALLLDPELERGQKAAVAAMRAGRDNAAVEADLDAVRAAAQGDTNLLYPMKAALAAGATVGEVSNVLRDVFGTF